MLLDYLFIIFKGYYARVNRYIPRFCKYGIVQLPGVLQHSVQSFTKKRRVP